MPVVCKELITLYHVTKMGDTAVTSKTGGHEQNVGRSSEKIHPHTVFQGQRTVFFVCPCVSILGQYNASRRPDDSV